MIGQLSYDLVNLGVFIGMFIKSQSHNHFACHATRAYVHPLTDQQLVDATDVVRVVNVASTFHVAFMLQIVVSSLGVIRGTYNLCVKGRKGLAKKI